jgi:hypothetical protein
MNKLHKLNFELALGALLGALLIFYVGFKGSLSLVTIGETFFYCVFSTIGILIGLGV